ncbi:MAG: Asp-tRNA(Asn)/Glu-tRNA(Gln) amidotransferase subunit GatA [Deltaproteobacteria bacterium]|nr:Asp-tRNA(Asn)/Glu-tRNA(Gln) amidotransferase subunit GatA [Candidatus Zymogenaceae bacterium]
MDPTVHTIHELADLLKSRAISSREATEHYIERIARINPKINAYLAVIEEHALEQADDADARIGKGEVGPLLGVPLAIKDVICTRGVPTTCGSRMLKDYVPPYDAAVIERLAQAGAVILGKTNMDEFAMGSSTESSYFGPTKNPHNTDYVPGGSSGGSAAAVAADLCAGALGSDTGGSIRQPASYSGVVGLKPTYGRVSRYGLVAYASSLDQIGPITKDVRDAALLLSAIAGHDKRDSTSLDIPVPDYPGQLTGDVKGMKVGLPKEYFGEGLDEEVSRRVRQAVDVLREGGAEIIDISLPHTEYALASYYIIAPSEASSNLARFDGVRYGYREVHPDGGLTDMFEHTRSTGFGAEVKRRIMLGTYALSAGYYDAYYKKALQVRRLIREDFDRAFGAVDVIACPAAPTPAYRIGEKIADPLSMYLGDIYTVTANLAGIPGISVPAGMNGQGLPIGLQLLGRPLGEAEILAAAHFVQKHRTAEVPKPII